MDLCSKNLHNFKVSFINYYSGKLLRNCRQVYKEGIAEYMRRYHNVLDTAAIICYLIGTVLNVLITRKVRTFSYHIFLFI